MTSVQAKRFWCCGQAQLNHIDEFDSHKQKSKAQFTQEIFVRATGSDSGKTPSPTITRTPSNASSSSADDDDEDATWFDCVEEFGEQDPNTGLCLEGTSSLQHTALEQAVAALPAKLATIVKKYKQGCCMGCKPTVALIKYMEDAGMDLEQLRCQLADTLAVEKSTDDLPTPTPDVPPLERTLSLRNAASQSEQASTSPDIQPAQQPQQQGTPSIARLLDNVSLVDATLSGMAREQGFKQVAWGKLELWYMHDHVHHRQVIKARTILDEPVVNITCLARELDLVTSWNPAISDARELASYSPSEVLMYMLCWTPWPLPGPEIVNYGMGVDLLDTKAGCMLIATKGQTELPEGVTVPANQRAVRLTMDAGGFKFVPLAPDPSRPEVPRTEATVLVSIDAKRFVVPDPVITFVLKVFSPLVYKSVVKVLAKLFHPDAQQGSQGGAGDSSHSVLLDRLHSRPEYAAIDEHVKVWMQQQQLMQS